MNTTPVLQGRLVTRGSCGRMAVDNTVLATWLSKMTRAGSPARFEHITDVSALARTVRRTWP